MGRKLGHGFTELDPECKQSITNRCFCSQKDSKCFLPIAALVVFSQERIAVKYLDADHVSLVKLPIGTGHGLVGFWTCYTTRTGTFTYKAIDLRRSPHLFSYECMEIVLLSAI